MRLLMITGDTSLAQDKKGPFYYMLQEFSKYWERIDIICPKVNPPAGGQKIFDVFGNVFIHASNLPKIFHPWFILKKGKEIHKQQKFDIFGIHSYPPFYNDIGGYWLYNKIKVPYVLEVMHINGHPKAGNIKERIYKILTRLFINFFARRSSAVRVINYKQVPEFLIKSGVERKKIKIAPAFYIDFEVFKPSITEKRYDIVFSGRLVENKGIKLFIDAVKILKLQIPNIKLMIIGTGPLENKIKKYIKKNGLQNNVVFSGWLPGIDDVARIYNQSKIMVMPSFNEGGPRVTLEAMACKISVITSRVGIMLDIIQDGQNGLFIDWDSRDIADKIKALLDDRELRERIAENGYQTIQQFERKKVIENYAKTYQALLYSA